MVQELNVDIPCSHSPKDKEPHRANRVWRWLRGENGSTRKRNKTLILWNTRASSLEAIIDYLVTAVIKEDLNYVHMFLEIHRTLATTQEVLGLLFARFGCVYSTYDEVGGPQDQRNMMTMKIILTNCEVSEVSPRVLLLLDHSQLLFNLCLWTSDRKTCWNHPYFAEKTIPVRHNGLSKVQTRSWLKPPPRCLRIFRGRRHKNAPEDMVQELNVDIPCSHSPKDKEPHRANRVWRWLRGENGSTRKRNKTLILWNTRASSLEAIIDYLVTAVIKEDLNYVHMFLEIHRTLATTQEVLGLLFARFGCVYSTYDEVGGPQDQRNMMTMKIILTNCEVSEVSPRVLLLLDHSQLLFNLCLWTSDRKTCWNHPYFAEKTIPVRHNGLSKVQTRSWLKPPPRCLRIFRGRRHKNAPEDMVQELNVDIPCSHSPKDKEPHRANRVWRWLRGENGSTRKRNKTLILWNTRASSLEAIIDYLVTAVIKEDLNYVHMFLEIHRTLATTQEVLGLLFARFGCVYSTYDEVGGPQDQRNMAVYAILDMWVERYPGDFVQPPEYPNLHALLAYLQVNAPGSDLLRRAQLLLPERQRAETTEPEAGGEEDWG
ncbi:uncharacterized protein LOC131813689 isoform X2 [Mustela lutreola]|nr:uncharacterized protein LOC131813689 isoform X2 [Mustela lutreola]